MIDSTSFRLALPPFGNVAAYPSSQVDFYIGLAYKLLSADRWGSVLDEGATLFVAHWLAVDALGGKGGVAGVPGTAIGVLVSGSVDKVSYSKDIQSVMEADAGHWNMTNYGLRFIRLARMMGAGPLHVGTPDAAELSLGAFAWPGVLPWYF